MSLPPALAPQAAPATVNYKSFAQQGLTVAQDLERFFLAVLGQSAQLSPGAVADQPNPFPVFGQQTATFAAAAGAGFAVPRQGAYAAAFGGFAAGAALGTSIEPQFGFAQAGYAQAGYSQGAALGQANVGFLALFGIIGGFQGAGFSGGYQAAAGGMAGLNLAAALYGAQPPNNLSASLAYSQQQRVTDDPYGVSQSGQGDKSDLANSPEAMLAIHEALKGKGVQSYEDLAKTLKETYGIEATSGDITVKDKDGKEHTVKGVKLGNGDYFIDGNGNGQLDAGDYKFDEAVKNVKDKYHLSDDDLKKVTEDLKTRAKNGVSNQPQSQQYPTYNQFPQFAQFPQVVYNPQMNMQIMVLFAQAFELAVA
ncbi:hypothetical protein JST97_28230 [bacterium]|nr:hypothetical protein [bacterium]